MDIVTILPCARSCRPRLQPSAILRTGSRNGFAAWTIARMAQDGIRRLRSPITLCFFVAPQVALIWVWGLIYCMALDSLMNDFEGLLNASLQILSCANAD